MKEYLDNNRSLWDGWTRLHAPSEFYDIEGFRAGNPPLMFSLRASRER